MQPQGHSGARKRTVHISGPVALQSSRPSIRISRRSLVLSRSTTGRSPSGDSALPLLSQPTAQSRSHTPGSLASGPRRGDLRDKLQLQCVGDRPMSGMRSIPPSRSRDLFFGGGQPGGGARSRAIEVVEPAGGVQGALQAASITADPEAEDMRELRLALEHTGILANMPAHMQDAVRRGDAGKLSLAVRKSLAQYETREESDSERSASSGALSDLLAQSSSSGGTTPRPARRAAGDVLQRRRAKPPRPLWARQFADVIRQQQEAHAGALTPTRSPGPLPSPGTATRADMLSLRTFSQAIAAASQIASFARSPRSGCPETPLRSPVASHALSVRASEYFAALLARSSRTCSSASGTVICQSRGHPQPGSAARKLQRSWRLSDDAPGEGQGQRARPVPRRAPPKRGPEGRRIDLSPVDGDSQGSQGSGSGHGTPHTDTGRPWDGSRSLRRSRRSRAAAVPPRPAGWQRRPRRRRRRRPRAPRQLVVLRPDYALVDAGDWVSAPPGAQCNARPLPKEQHPGARQAPAGALWQPMGGTADGHVPAADCSEADGSPWSGLHLARIDDLGGAFAPQPPPQPPLRPPRPAPVVPPLWDRQPPAGQLHRQRTLSPMPWSGRPRRVPMSYSLAARRLAPPVEEKYPPGSPDRYTVLLAVGPPETAVPGAGAPTPPNGGAVLHHGLIGPAAGAQHHPAGGDPLPRRTGRSNGLCAPLTSGAATPMTATADAPTGAASVTSATAHGAGAGEHWSAVLAPGAPPAVTAAAQQPDAALFPAAPATVPPNGEQPWLPCWDSDSDAQTGASLPLRVRVRPPPPEARLCRVLPLTTKDQHPVYRHYPFPPIRIPDYSEKGREEAKKRPKNAGLQRGHARLPQFVAALPRAARDGLLKVLTPLELAQFRGVG